MKKLICILVITTFLFIGNSAYAWFLRIDGADPHHYLAIDGTGTNILMICPGRTGKRGLHRLGLGLQLH